MNCVHCGYNSDSEICPNCGASMPVVQQNDNYYHDNNQNYNQQQYNNADAYNNYEQQYPQQQYNQPYNDQQYNNNQYNNQYNNNQYDNPYAPGYNNGYNNDNGYNNGYNNGNNNNNGNNTNNNNILVAIISVAAVVIIGLVAALVVFSMDKPEKETTTTTTEATTEYEEDEDDDSYDVDIDVDVDRTEYSSTGVVQPDYSLSGTFYYVTADIGLILRKGPGKGYSKILTIPYGNRVSAEGASNSVSGWYYVYYSGYYGWVSTQYLSTYKPYKTTTKSYDVDDVFMYDSYYTKYVSPYKGLNIRTGASTSCYSLATLPQGTRVVVKGKSAYNGSWVYVTAYPPCGNVYSGFVSAQYLRY